MSEKIFICSYISDNGRYNLEISAASLIQVKTILKRDYITGTTFKISQLENKKTTEYKVR
jgi:hypothetical protein